MLNDDDRERMTRLAGVGPSASEVCDLIAYMEPFNGYVRKGVGGRWDLTCKLTREAAGKKLSKHGYDPFMAKQILGNNMHLTLAGVSMEQSRSPECYGPDGQLHANAYHWPDIKPQAGDWAVIREMVDVVTNHDPAGAAWLLNWMAAKVQQPLAPSRGAVVFHGGQGIGKTQLGHFLCEILGKANCGTIGQMDIESSFNGHFVGKIFIVADEVITVENSRHTQSRLKSLISDSTLMVNSKGVPGYQVQNRMSWWFTSNESTAVRVEGQDDRHYLGVFHQPKSGYSMPEYLARIKSLFVPGTSGGLTAAGRSELAAFAHELGAWQVDWDAATRPYRNESRNEMVVVSQNSVAAFADRIREGGIIPYITKVLERDTLRGDHKAEIWDFEVGEGRAITASGLYACYVLFCGDNGYKPCNSNLFGRRLTEVKGIVRTKTAHYRGYLGVLKSDEIPYSRKPTIH